MILATASAAGSSEEAARLERSIREKFQSFTVSASQCGDLQSCIDTLPDWGTLDGEGATFLVTQLNLKSRMRLRNFRLVKAAGAANLTSPINLDGKTSPKEDVVIEDVAIDGRRQQEIAIETPSAEDGGRHCFRIAGKVSNVVLANVQGTYCASDGLQLGGQHATWSDQPEELPLQNIVVRNARFEWNRRAGIAFEGGHNLYFLDVAANFNGRSLEPSDRTSGNHCAHVNGVCFGTGVWTENDHDAAGGSFDSVYFLRLESRENFTRGFYAYSNSGPLVSGFRTKGNLIIADSTIDAGVEPIPGNPIAIQFSSASPDGAGAVYRGVTIRDSQIAGTICGRSIESLSVWNSTLTGPLAGFFEYFDQVEIVGGTRNGDFVSSLNLRPDGTPSGVIRYETGVRRSSLSMSFSRSMLR